MAALVTGKAAKGRCIALTGPWGSGKSSVVLQLQKRLEASRGNPTVDMFVFDAWIHQGDPLRRCFLERLMEFAKVGGATSYEEWKRDLDLITGRREVTKAKQEKPASLLAVTIAISLLVCIPLGSAFLGRYDGKTGFWSNPFALLAIGMYAIPAGLGLWAWFTGGLSNLASTVIRDLHQDTETETVRTREASSIDFKRLFGKIAAEMLANHIRRLVIVIDNLDRIDAVNAVSMWTTMRTFFDFEQEKWSGRVWLIVPFDRSALGRLWKTSNGDATAGRPGPDLADSFLEKTFQIVFHLSPPVLTRLRSYFQAQMGLAFDDDLVRTHFESVYRIHSLLGPPTPSPRQVKTFLNKLHAQTLLWTGAPGEAVSLPFLAVQVLKVDELVGDSGVLIREEFLSAEAVNVLTQCAPEKDWRQQVAAAHFGVPPDDALQMLLFDRFNRAFQSGDYQPLADVRNQPYFWTAFRGYADAQHREWIRNPTALANAILFVEEAHPLDVRDFRADLLNKASLAVWAPLDSRRLQALGVMIHNGENQAEALKLLENTLKAVSSVGSMTAGQWANLFAETMQAVDPFVPDDFTVTLDAPIHFVEAQTELFRRNGDDPVWRRVRLKPGADVIGSYLSAVSHVKSYAEFSALRQRAAEGAGISYKNLNQALLNSQEIGLDTTLDLLMPAATPPEAALGEDSMARIDELAGPTLTPRLAAARLILARERVLKSPYIDLLKASSLPPEMVDATVDVLRAWDRREAMFDPNWYGPQESLLQALWSSLMRRNLTAEIPLKALAQLYPTITVGDPPMASALVQVVASRLDIVEALA